MMATSFSNSGEDVIQRSIAPEKLQDVVLEVHDIGTVFEINKTAVWINKHGFKKVCTNLTETTLNFLFDAVQPFQWCRRPHTD